jgi:hypothetical protein
VQDPEAVVAEISRQGLAELHTHLGGSVASDVLWMLAREQGIALPFKDYWDFENLVTVDPRSVDGLPELTSASSKYRPPHAPRFPRPGARPTASSASASTR